MSEPIGRVPPHSKRYERAMISALVGSEDAWDLTRGMLAPEDFWHADYRAIYEHAVHIGGASRHPDMLALAERFHADPRTAYLEPIMTEATNAEPLAAYRAVELAKDLRKLSRRRRVLTACMSLTGSGYDASVETDEWLARAEADVFAALQDDAVTSGPQRIDMRAAVKRLEKRSAVRESGGARGLLSTIPAIDAMTQGFGDGHLWVVGGRPGEGKTALAQQIASAAADRNEPGIVFSLEMPNDELVDRAFAAQGVPLQALRAGALSQWHWDRIAVSVGRMDAWPLYIDDTPGITLAALSSATKLAVRRHGIRWVIIDYLQLMRSGIRRKGENREQEVAEISKGLKELAKLCKLPIIVLSQFNREADGVRPKKSHFRESGAIEQDADGCILIWNEKVLEGVRTTLIVDKNRHGPCGDVRVMFDGPSCTFTQSDEQ